jgi:hypothetical protein
MSVDYANSASISLIPFGPFSVLLMTLVEKYNISFKTQKFDLLQSGGGMAFDMGRLRGFFGSATRLLKWMHECEAAL